MFIIVSTDVHRTVYPQALFHTITYRQLNRIEAGILRGTRGCVNSAETTTLVGDPP